MPITPLIKRDYLENLAKQGKREDGRAFDEYRKIEIETGVVLKAEGSARVKIGNTQVLAGIKIDTGEPYRDTPAEGVMTTAAELIPLASPDFEAGPPDRESIELARVVDRGIRESGVIELDKLCIVPGSKIWMIFIDIHILDYDGNLFDAASLASLAALLNSKVPARTKRDSWLIDDALTGLQEKDTKIREFMENNQKLLLKMVQQKESVWKYMEKNHKDLMDILSKKYPIAWDYWKKHEDDFQLPMIEPPISCSSVKYNGIVVVDPSLDEEEIAEARLTVAIDNNGHIRAMQKGLSGSFTKEEIKKVIKASTDNGKKIREKLYKSVGK